MVNRRIEPRQCWLSHQVQCPTLSKRIFASFSVNCTVVVIIVNSDQILESIFTKEKEFKSAGIASPNVILGDLSMELGTELERISAHVMTND